MLRAMRVNRSAALLLCCLELWALSCARGVALDAAPLAAAEKLVTLTAFEFDSKQPERKNFGALRLMSAFHLQSKDPRFGGLSGLSFGADGRLYAVSDRGYWLSAKLRHDAGGALTDAIDWQIAPMLTPAQLPVSGSLADAEALTRAADGTFLVGFEGTHRIWRYAAPPATFSSTPAPISVPAPLARAPRNGGIEGLTALPDGRLLALTEEFANPDGSFKGWLIDGQHFAELSYVPANGFRVTDCAALKSGDILVLERRFNLLQYLSARLVLVEGKALRPGAKISGRELLRLEAPLTVENFEGLAVQSTAKGEMLYLVSDDNYNPFQATLLLQFWLPNGVD